MNHWIVHTQALTKIYRMGESEVAALRGVDLQMAAGEFVALTGASGSGKSTLMHLLGCLDSPSSGRYWLRGQEVSGLSASQRSRVRNGEIGFVFQSFNLLPRLTALENVALPLYYRRSSAHAQRAAQEALARVGMQDRLHHRPAELSGGQCQRVAIARALVGNPALILADEPTGNLDSVTSAEVMALLGELHRAGSTLLLVTHDAAIAAHAERTLKMHDGRLVST